MRFINADDPNIIQMGSTEKQELNLYAYCVNDPVNCVDPSGYFGTPIQWACAAIGGVLGVFFGDSIARLMGFAPNQNFWRATTYWAIRAAVIIGGAAIGYLVGTGIIKLVATFIKANPTVVIKLIKSLEVSTTTKIMNIFGLNFMSYMSSGMLISFAQQVLSKPSLKLSLDFVKLLYNACKAKGIKMTVDAGHPGTLWNFFHLHIGKNRVHIGLVKAAYE